jgi:hypothetical protein
VTKKTVKKIQTDEDKIFGNEITAEVIKEYDYESADVKYRVTSSVEGTTPVIVNGTVIETFIGLSNRDARKALKEGAKEVTCIDVNGKEVYKIEVVK